jgi:hypothetical protein
MWPLLAPGPSTAVGRRPAPCRRRVPDLQVAVRYGACGWTRTNALQVRNLVLYPSKLRPQLALLAGLEPATSVIRRLSAPRLAKTPPPRSRSVWPSCPVLCKIKLQNRVVHAPGVAPDPRLYQSLALLLRHTWMVEMTGVALSWLYRPALVSHLHDRPFLMSLIVFRDTPRSA